MDIVRVCMYVRKHSLPRTHLENIEREKNVRTKYRYILISNIEICYHFNQIYVALHYSLCYGYYICLVLINVVGLSDIQINLQNIVRSLFI